MLLFFLISYSCFFVVLMFSLPIWWLLDLMFLVSTHDEVIFIVLLLLGTDLYVRELGMADVLMLQLVHRAS
ncbi:hypothetical protein BDA96_10G305900 [Sorghum bicolor]|uniref:Uncharacterized protein n=1 Tax=Sorghum bicolor TaxID=4558 RepID=A0A921Q6C0_SORBI|nr:hypothetical protein BDA96_10G305900 [Sorghum bicolor]